MQIYYEDDQACLFDPESYHGKTSFMRRSA